MLVETVFSLGLTMIEGRVWSCQALACHVNCGNLTTIQRNTPHSRGESNEIGYDYLVVMVSSFPGRSGGAVSSDYRGNAVPL